MAVNNSLQPKAQPQKFSVAIRQDKWQDLINNTLGDKGRAGRFVASITSAVAVTPALQTCEPGSVLSAALLGEVLNLSPSPQLGHFYLVPYKQKAKFDRYGNLLSPESTIAQFQLGYKGYIQLAIRSGYYRKIIVLPIKEGELLAWNPMEEDISVQLIEDEAERESKPTIGYYAMFEYVKGTFRKVMYWSKAKMEKHADRYSQAFHLNAVEDTNPKYSRVSYEDFLAGKFPASDEWKYSSFWYKDFDGMACKTMLRQLISKWGIMSVELQKAFSADENAVNADMTPNYLEPEKDNTPGLLPPVEGDNSPAAGNPDGPEQPPELPDGIFDEAQQI
jgi:recombination protein RecT